MLEPRSIGSTREFSRNAQNDSGYSVPRLGGIVGELYCDTISRIRGSRGNMRILELRSISAAEKIRGTLNITTPTACQYWGSVGQLYCDTVSRTLRLERQSSNSGAEIHWGPPRKVEEGAKLLGFLRAQTGGAWESYIVTQSGGF